MKVLNKNFGGEVKKKIIKTTKKKIWMRERRKKSHCEHQATDALIPKALTPPKTSDQFFLSL